VAVQGTSDEITRIGQTITDRNLDIQPTITVKPGFPIRIMVHKDMILAPYQETRWGNRSTRNQSTYGW
jgi:type IV secretory pathway VirB10-like protein